MYTQPQIGNAGERIVNSWLTQNGYRTNLDTRQPGSTDIEAVGSKASLLVQVKTAMSPSVPADPSPDEVRNIKSRASRLGYQAWQAKATVNSSLQIMNEIQWKRLDAS